MLGKKDRQLSFLHVYHHTTIFAFYWLNLHINYDGAIYLTILLNGAIHFVMYTYYFVCLHEMKSRPWWKKYVTMCQMVQFLSMMTQAGLLLGEECKAPSPRVVTCYLVYIFSLFLLFANFFVKNYGGGGKKRKQK